MLQQLLSSTEHETGMHRSTTSLVTYEVNLGRAVHALAGMDAQALGSAL